MAERSPLPRTVRAVLGTQASEDFVIWQESAHESLRDAIRSDIRADMDARFEAITHRLDTLEDKLTDRIQQVDRRVGDAKADLMRWSFVFWVGAVAAVAALAGVLQGN